MRAANELFALPLTDKLRVAAEGSQRGYLTYGSEAGVADYFEPKEGYSYGLDSAESEHELQRRNVWPASYPSESAEDLDRVFDHLVRVLRGVVSALQMAEEARSFSGRPDESCEQTCAESDRVDYEELSAGGERISILRLFKYYPASNHSSKAQLGSSPHTDWGLLTAIMHDGSPGLQFFSEGQWLSAPDQQDSVLINGGDALRLLSGGRYRSPVHRVLCPAPLSSRTSFVLFFYPRFDCPLPASLGETSNLDGDRPDGDFNTLVSAGYANASARSFGDYIVEKWNGVSAY